MEAAAVARKRPADEQLTKQSSGDVTVPPQPEGGKAKDSVSLLKRPGSQLLNPDMKSLFAETFGQQSVSTFKFGGGAATAFGHKKEEVAAYEAPKLSSKPSSDSSSGAGGFGNVATGFGSFGGGFKTLSSSTSTQFDKKETGSFSFKTSGKLNMAMANSGKTEEQKRQSSIVTLARVEHQSTGEENDSVAFTRNAKLYRFTDGGWAERGSGTLTLNDSKTQPNSSRLVMRQTSKRLILNAPIWSGLRPELASEKAIRFTAFNAASESAEAKASPKAEIFLLKAGTDAKRLLGLLEARVAKCEPVPEGAGVDQPQAEAESGADATAPVATPSSTAATGTTPAAVVPADSTEAATV